MEDVGPAAQAICFPPFRLDLATEQLWRGTELLAIRPKTFAVLRYLVEHAGRLVTREELCQAVWPQTVGSERAPKQCIRELRSLLGDRVEAPCFIETLARRGWRFIASLTTTPFNQEPKVKSYKSSPTPSPQHPAPTLVGREEELARLHEWLKKALNGERQIIFVTGEPGIGKSTLVEAFQHPLANQGLWVGHGQCIEQHGAGEAFLPVLDALGRLARGAGSAHLIEILRTYAPMWLVQLPTLIDGEELEALQRKVQGATRDRMLREMAEALERLAAEQPVLLVLEDLHWSDVSTLDLLAFLARRKGPARLLVIGTYRPVEMLNDRNPLQGVTQELYAHRLATELPLGVLSEAETAAYLTARLQVPSPLKREGQGEGERSRVLHNLALLLHHSTGGNPLFLVSTVDELVAQGILTQTDHSWSLPGEIADIGIAESIRHLVARQRGRLSVEECQTLEAASVAGMEFSAAAVAAALMTETMAIERCCEQLAERQHFLRRVGIEKWPDGTLAARYSFLHAVYQQLWHERVTPTQLQRHHLQIGERKEAAYGWRAREIASELAVHFEQGRDYRKAVQYLRQAGQNALRRSANQEAVPLLTRGLDLLKMLPETPERAQQELRLQVTLATPLMASKGYAALEVERACRRALELCQQIGETPQLFPVLGMLHTLYFNRRELSTAHEFATQLLHLAQNARDPRLLLWAHYALGFTLAEQGELLAARAHLEQSIALYDPQQNRLPDFVQDPRVTGLAELAHILLSLGYFDQAFQQSEEALALARELTHPFSLAWVLEIVARFHMRRREPQAAQILAEELSTLVSKQGFAFLQAQETFRRGWDLVERGQRNGIALMRQGLTDDSTIINLGLLANAYGTVGQPKEGLNALSKALAIINKTQEFAYTAELYRLKGELTLQSQTSLGQVSNKSQTGQDQSEPPNPQPLIPSTQAEVEVEACFLKAIDIARKQSAKFWELRASTSLARLWQLQGKTKQAHQLLSEIYSWFTEGFGTADLKDAKALLKQLS